MVINRRSFFGRILFSLFLGGCLPFIALSIMLSVMTANILENAYKKRADAAVAQAAATTRQMLSETADMARELASSKAIIDYVRIPKKDSGLILECTRLLLASMESASIYPYIIPGDGTPPLSREAIPDEYAIPLYEGWGILGELERSTEKSPVVYFAQPHPLSGRTVPLAVGTRVYDGETPGGFVVIDMGRRLFVDRIGSGARSGGALTSLCLVDRSGCIVFDMSDAGRESTFLDVEGSLAKESYIARQPASGGIEVHGTVAITAVREYAGRVVATTLTIVAINMLVSLAMAIVLSKSLAHPVHMLTLTMERVSRGYLDAYCPEASNRQASEEIAILIKQFNLMIRRVNELVENKVAQERELRRAESRALQAQINPHFLYNTLNSIRSSAKLAGAEEIAAVISRLARIMREGSYSGSGFCTVEHSLEIARDYFAIESWRWPGRFQLRESLDEGIADAIIPRLIIQPLVENALTHGLEAKPGPGTLTIEGRMTGAVATIAIKDDGAGIEPERLERIAALLRKADSPLFESSLAPDIDDSADSPLARPMGEGSGIALINTHSRLRLIYGPPYGLSVASRRGEGTTITVSFPIASVENGQCSS